MSFQKYVNDLAEMTSLVIRQDDVDHGNMMNYGNYCKKLKKVTFDRCSNVSQSLMSCLFQRNSSIEELVFVDCGPFGRDCFEYLRSLQSLRILDLTGYQLNENEESSLLRVGLKKLETIIFGYPFNHIYLFYHYYPTCKVIFKLKSDSIMHRPSRSEEQREHDRKNRSSRSREKKIQKANELMMENLCLDDNQPSCSSRQRIAIRRISSKEEKRMANYNEEVRQIRHSRFKNQFSFDSPDTTSDSSNGSRSPFNKSKTSSSSNSTTSSSSSSDKKGAASREYLSARRKRHDRSKSRSPRELSPRL